MVYNIGLGINTGHGYATMNVDTRSHLDLTMSLPHNNNRLHNLNNYVSSQTFHAPSFGDEDFELPPISLHSIPATGTQLAQSLNGYSNQQQLSHSNSAPSSLTLTQPLSHPAISVSSSCSIGGTALNNHSSHHQIIPKFPPQNIHIPDIMSMTDSQSDNAHMTYTTSVMSVNSLNTIDSMNTINLNQLNSSPSTGYMSSPLTTISQSDLSSQLGIHSMTTRQALLNSHHQASPSGSSNTSPVRDSSEDSDDMLPLSQLALKRSAADQTPVITNNKKQKTPKKKKVPTATLR